MFDVNYMNATDFVEKMENEHDISFFNLDDSYCRMVFYRDISWDEVAYIESVIKQLWLIKYEL